MLKETLFGQIWWVSVAAVLAGIEFVFAFAVAFEPNVDILQRVITSSSWAASGGIALLGVLGRPRHRRRGDALIAVGVVPAVLAGIVFFWFPPLWLTTVTGTVVLWSSISDAWGRPQEATS